MKKHEVEYKGKRYKLSEEQYEELKTVIELTEKAGNSKLSDFNSDDLVDIKSVNMDQGLSKLENVVKFINEVKNPYYFNGGKVKVRVSYADTKRVATSVYWIYIKNKGANYMKTTGIVRRIEALGRVVIPKEIRRTMRIP